MINMNKSHLLSLFVLLSILMDLHAYTITFDAGMYGQPIAAIEVEPGQKCNLPSITWVKTEYASRISCSGWYADEIFVGNQYATITPTSDLHLTAKYTTSFKKTWFKLAKHPEDLVSELGSMRMIFINDYSNKTYRYAIKADFDLGQPNTGSKPIRGLYYYFPTAGNSTNGGWVDLTKSQEFSLDLSNSNSYYVNTPCVWTITRKDTTKVTGFDGVWGSNNATYLFNRSGMRLTSIAPNGTYKNAITTFNFIADSASSMIEWAEWTDSRYRYFKYSGSTYDIGSETDKYNKFLFYREAREVSFDYDDEFARYANLPTTMREFEKFVLPTIPFKHAAYAPYISILGWADENGNIVGQPGDTILVSRNMSLHPLYTIQKFTVTFDAAEHGSCSISDTVSLLPFVLPQVTVQNGWYFQGWASRTNDRIVGKAGDIYPAEQPILSYNDQLYAVYQNSYNVIEWTTNSVLVEFLNSAVSAQTQIGEGTPQMVALSSAKEDAGLFRLPVPDLCSSAGLPLTITFKNAYGEIVSSAVTEIPLIINGTINIADEIDRGSSASRDLVILNGSVVTAATVPYSFRDIYVYAGGKLVVPTGAVLNTQHIYLRAGAIENGMYQFRYPQMVVNGAIHNSSGVVNLDYLMNQKQYYSLCLPYTVDVSAVTYRDGKPLKFNSYWWGAVYNGAVRATGASGWEYFNGTRLQAGLGYTVAAAPQSVRIMGGSATQRSYSAVRFPMMANLENGETTSSKTTPVVSYPSQTGKDNDAGWNLVGNPFMANYGGLVDGLTSNGIGLLVDDGNGGYYWQGNVRYVVMPSDDGLSFSPEVATGTHLPAFKNFFVQIGPGDNALEFSLANRAQSVPARLLTQTEPQTQEIMVGLKLCSSTQTDKLGVLVGEEFTLGYEVNADLDKMMNQTEFNCYALTDDKSALSFIAIPPQQIHSIALAYQVPKAGNYTWQIDKTFDLSRVQSVILYDIQTQTSVDLLQEKYSFTTAQSEHVTNRFLLSIALQQSATPTDIKPNLEGDVQLIATQNGLSITNVRHATHIDIYDPSGRKVIEETLQTDGIITLSQGLYIVQVTSQTKCYTTTMYAY